tara:strand:+ start:88 stop:591 length:504 start_codon:yes stop_codon:yes gene_type:complete
MTAISGRKYLQLCKQSGQLGAFSRMFMDTLAWASTKCYLTWKPKATPQGRLLFQLAVSMPRTEETGSGLWATPRTTDGTGGPRKLDEKGRRISQTNPDLVFGANLADQVKMWPTPTANKDACGTPNGKMQKMLGNHPEVRNTGAGTLNPQWVEWLMGYPEGWTDLKD